jgi:hypothetical protein
MLNTLSLIKWKLKWSDVMIHLLKLPKWIRSALSVAGEDAKMVMFICCEAWNVI